MEKKECHQMDLVNKQDTIVALVLKNELMKMQQVVNKRVSLNDMFVQNLVNEIMLQNLPMLHHVFVVIQRCVDVVMQHCVDVLMHELIDRVVI